MKYGLTVCCVGDLNLETVISDLYNRVWNGIRLSCTEDGQTAGSSKESGTQHSCFLSKERNGLVPVSHRLFVEVFVSGNKSCLYGYDVPDTSIYQKDHWTGIPGSDPTISLSVRLWIFFKHKNSTPVFYLE